jgi:hypothetical protein
MLLMLLKRLLWAQKKIHKGQSVKILIFYFSFVPKNQGYIEDSGMATVPL